VTGGSLSGESTNSQQKSWMQSQQKAQQQTWSQAPIQTFSAAPVQTQTFASQRAFVQPPAADHDGSAYAFAYKTDSHSRQESSDASGHVKGNYAVQTDGGHQQFSFETGSKHLAAEKVAPSWDQSSTGFASRFDSNQQLQSQGQLDQSFNFNIPSTHRMHIFNTGKSAHPTYTIITPKANQKSFEYGQKNDVVLAYFPPQHPEKYGYIYDTQN
jgi:hypothetical protein